MAYLAIFGIFGCIFGRELVEQGMAKPTKKMRANILRWKEMREKLLPGKELGKKILSKKGLMEKILSMK